MRKIPRALLWLFLPAILALLAGGCCPCYFSSGKEARAGLYLPPDPPALNQFIEEELREIRKEPSLEDCIMYRGETLITGGLRSDSSRGARSRGALTASDSSSGATNASPSRRAVAARALFHLWFGAQERAARAGGQESLDLWSWTADDLRGFGCRWMGDAGKEPDPCGALLEYGLAKPVVKLEDARPGDLVDWEKNEKDSPPGVFLRWIRDSAGRPAGVLMNVPLPAGTPSPSSAPEAIYWSLETEPAHDTIRIVRPWISPLTP